MVAIGLQRRAATLFDGRRESRPGSSSCLFARVTGIRDPRCRIPGGRQSEALADAVIARHKRRKNRVRRITIDLDPTHGAQQLAFFNRF